MENKNLKKQKKVLEDLKLKLQKQLEAFKRSANFGESADDNAQEVSSATTNLSLKKDITTEIKAIDKALAAILSGKYGVCQLCNIPIESGRLKLVPTALYCSSCQSKNKRKK